MQSEAKRLLAGSRAQYWHKLATSVSAASSDNTRDYHDTYLLADALSADDGAWLETELTEQSKDGRTSNIARENEAAGSVVGAPEEGALHDAGIAEPDALVGDTNTP